MNSVIVGIAPMNERDKPIPLRDAIREFTPEHKWAVLLKAVGGSNDDAIQVLSGEWAGQLSLAAEIVSKTAYADRERKLLREAQDLCADIVGAFEARRSVDLVLKGFTVASPGRPITVSPELQLKFDFVNGAARSGDIQFQRVTVRIRAQETAKAGAEPQVSNADLQAFCKKLVEGRSPAPSIDMLVEAVREEFTGKHVARKRIREMHKVLIPAPSRRSGPRK